MFDPIAQAFADEPAIIQGERRWTFKEMNDRANALAHGLQGLGASGGAKALWISPNDEKVLLFGHAARKCGMVAVPLPYRFTPEEMEYVINDSDAFLVFCAPDYRTTLEGLNTPNLKLIVDFDQAEELIADNPADPIEDAHEGMGASMIYTSGTTGKPKGALRTQTDLGVVAALIGELGIGREVHITTGPLYHSGPGAFAALSQLLGGSVVILEKFDPNRWLELVDEHRCTFTFTAPTQLKRIVAQPDEVRAKYDTSSLKCVIANAAPVPYALKKQWIEAFGEGHLFEVYGSTELGVDTVLRPEDQLRKPGSCGKPYGGVEIRIITEDGRDAEADEPGVMWIKSPGAFDEYHKAPEKTEGTKLADDPAWQTVGDVAYRDEEGYFYICDRANDMIISGGMNIYPAEIEGVLHAHPAVLDAGVFGVPNEEWGEQVHAVVQLKQGESATQDELETHCRQTLSGYKVPRSWEFRDELPRTESGKLLKRQLRDEHWGDRTSRV